MSENEEECEIFLIIGGSTDHSSQQLFLLSYQSLDVTCALFIIIMGRLHIWASNRMVKD